MFRTRATPPIPRVTPAPFVTPPLPSAGPPAGRPRPRATAPTGFMIGAMYRHRASGRGPYRIVALVDRTWAVLRDGQQPPFCKSRRDLRRDFEPMEPAA